MTYNNFKGITIPCKAVEGAISIVETDSVTGDGKKPTVANKIHQGDAVAIVGDFRVELAEGSNGVIIGFAHDHPEWDVDPTTNYTKAQAIAANMLKNIGVETPFTDVRTVPAKSGEGISAGDYVEFGANGQSFEKSDSETNMIALAGQNSDDEIVIGIK